MDVDDAVCPGVLVVDSDVVADVVRRQAPRALPPCRPGGLCTGTTEEKAAGKRTGKKNSFLGQETFLAWARITFLAYGDFKKPSLLLREIIRFLAQFEVFDTGSWSASWKS